MMKKGVFKLLLKAPVFVNANDTGLNYSATFTSEIRMRDFRKSLIHSK